MIRVRSAYCGAARVLHFYEHTGSFDAKNEMVPAPKKAKKTGTSAHSAQCATRNNQRLLVPKTLKEPEAVWSHP